MPAPYLFLRKDFERLERKIGELGDEMLRVGSEMGIWASQGAETWHDNFGYEEGLRQEEMLGHRSEEFEALASEAEIVTEATDDKVGVGTLVELEDNMKRRRRFLVSSYLVLDRRDDREVSYAAPIIAPFMGAAVGEERSVELPRGEQVWRVVSIERTKIAD